MHEDEEQPIDFSSIDPSRDAPRWDAMVAAVAARARARRPTFARVLVRRGVPMVAVAAAAALAVWIARPRPAPLPDMSRDPADVIASWALTGGGDPIELLSGGDHAGR